MKQTANMYFFQVFASIIGRFFICSNRPQVISGTDWQQYQYTFMTSYIQTTIHSKIAKQQKTTSQGLGSIMRGRVHAGKTNSHEKDHELQIAREIEILPKSKININRKMRNKVIPSQSKGEQIVLMQSAVFPAIYFKKTTMRNILKQFVFPNDVRALPPSDDRTPLIFQIISNLFNEITFYIFNILIGQNTVTGSFYVFFSDSETIPFTKCCNAPVYIQLQSNGSGKILCNSLKCPNPNIAQFLINFQDGKKLWQNIVYFSDASEKDKELRSKISKVIMNGKYKKVNLVQIVQQTSKQIVDLFYSMKKAPLPADKPQQQFQDKNLSDQTPFLTANDQQFKSTAGRQQSLSLYNNQQSDSLEQLLHYESNNVDDLKMKIGYLVRQQKDMNRKVVKSLVNDGKVFQKNFQMIKKIDQFMITQKSSKNGTKFNFPRLMDQLKKNKLRQTLNNKARSTSAYHSFT